jgi:hypothetical protein
LQGIGGPLTRILGADQGFGKRYLPVAALSLLLELELFSDEVEELMDSLDLDSPDLVSLDLPLPLPAELFDSPDDDGFVFECP